MHDPGKYRPIPTIDDWLNLSDWTFKSKYQEGQHGELFWVSPSYSCDVLDCIELPETPFRILVTSFDNGPRACFGTEAGWQMLGETRALSEPMVENLLPSYGTDMELMLIDEAISVKEIASRLKRAGELTNPEDPDFWNFIETMQPYCFVTYDIYTQQLFFVAKKKELIESLYSAETLARVEQAKRKYLRASRVLTWEQLGPECGPETCVDFGCNRLRIQLAVRCFLHQYLF